MNLAEFKQAFPKYADMDDETLTFWFELSACMVCIPRTCKAIQTRIPYLMLDHILIVNGVGDDDQSGDDGCDDSVITKILSNGQNISSANIDGMAVSFDSSGVNTKIATMTGNSPFHAWLSATASGRMLSVILRRLAGGPVMAVSGTRTLGHFEEPRVMGHLGGRFGN